MPCLSMSSAETDAALLFHTINSFGRQHHLNKQRFERMFAANGNSAEPLQPRTCSQPLPDVHRHSRQEVIQASGGLVNHMWFDAEECAACASASCDQHTCGVSPSSRSEFHDALSDGVRKGIDSFLRDWCL